MLDSPAVVAGEFEPDGVELIGCHGVTLFDRHAEVAAGSLFDLDRVGQQLAQLLGSGFLRLVLKRDADLCGVRSCSSTFEVVQRVEAGRRPGHTNPSTNRKHTSNMCIIFIW